MTGRMPVEGHAFFGPFQAIFAMAFNRPGQFTQQGRALV